MNRRDALRAMTVSTIALSRTPLLPADEPLQRSGLGLVLYCCGLRRKHHQGDSPGEDLFAPAVFLEHCRRVGAGGMQVPLGVLETADAIALRRKAEQDGLFIEAIIRVPSDRADIERFEAEMQTAVAVGARAVRTTIIPGRRYEFFDTLEKFREYESRGRMALEMAVPVAEKLQLPIAVENHKDHRNDERIALFEHISSEYVGACVDTGNSVALLEDAEETVAALAPWAHAVHLKDQAVQPTADGFLLGDIPLGTGFINLKPMVALLKTERPGLRFSLELITRDPLQVPCLTEPYWATFPDVPGRDLARTLRAVRAGATDNLQYVSRLSPAEQVALEDSNVRASLDYARDQLKL